MKVCPTNALQPAIFETGLEGIWTPLLCRASGRARRSAPRAATSVPTGAIRPFTWQDKRYKIKMGLANVNQSTCVAWNGGRDCVVCAEVCPYSAVVFRDKWDDGLPKDPTPPDHGPGQQGPHEARPDGRREALHRLRHLRVPLPGAAGPLHRRLLVPGRPRVQRAGRNADRRLHPSRTGSSARKRARPRSTPRPRKSTAGAPRSRDPERPPPPAADSRRFVTREIDKLAPTTPAHPHTRTRPFDWYYHLLPLRAEGDEALPLDWVVERAAELISRAEATGEPAHFSPALHWAHLLKLEQGPDGDWPAVVNARTGEAIGTRRTRRPAEMLARLGQLLDSTEFEAAVALAACRAQKFVVGPLHRAAAGHPPDAGAP